MLHHNNAMLRLCLKINIHKHNYSTIILKKRPASNENLKKISGWILAGLRYYRGILCNQCRMYVTRLQILLITDLVIVILFLTSHPHPPCGH